MHTSSGRRRRALSMAEVDAYSQWGKRYLLYVRRAGVRKQIKRETHRRERREGRRETQE